MTLEEMQARAGRIVELLEGAGYSNVEYLREDHKPGEPLPIVYDDDEGNTLSLSLTVA